MSELNHVFINPDGYVEATIVGDQTGMSFEHLHYDAADMLDNLEKQGKRRLGLIDLTQEGSFSTDSNKAAMQILESLNYEKLALYGGNSLINQVVNAIILAMGKTNNTKFFKDRQSALDWLQQPSDV